MFLFKDALGERCFIVIIQHRDRSLNDDGAAIDSRVHKMDRAACHFNAVFQGLPLTVYTWEGRQQGRMNIHNALGKGAQKNRSKNPHEAGQYDQVDFGFVQGCHHGPVECFAIGEFLMVDNDNRNTGLARPY